MDKQTWARALLLAEDDDTGGLGGQIERVRVRVRVGERDGGRSRRGRWRLAFSDARR